MSHFRIATMEGAAVVSIPVADAQWNTERDGKAAQFTFKYPRDCGIRLEEGQLISFMMDEDPVFVGYVFKSKASKSDLIDVTAFDQMRYLQNKSTYLFKGETLDEIVAMLAHDMGLQVGPLAKASTPIQQVNEDSKLIDIIEEARNATMDKEGVLYQIWDNCGSLSMARLPQDRMTDLFIGDASLLTDYSYERSIDSDTYNRVILYKKDGDEGKYIVEKAVDEKNIDKWGVLQYLKKADEKMSRAEMKAEAEATLAVRNRVKRELTLDAVGDRRCEAGCSIYVGVEQEGLRGWALINRAEHRFEGKGAHTMKLTMNMIDAS